MTRAFFLLAALAVGACDTGDGYRLSPEERAAYEGRIDSAVRDLEAAIGQARADDLAACRVVASNTDACGTETTFRVYSVADGDSLEIRRLAARADSLSRAYSRAIGVEPPCVVAEPPPLVLEDGRCRFEPQVIVD